VILSLISWLVNFPVWKGLPVLKICFGPPTAESKNLKNHVNFDVGDLFFRSPALWSSQNVFGPPTAGRVVVDFKDRAAAAAPPRPPHLDHMLKDSPQPHVPVMFGLLNTNSLASLDSA